MGTSKLIASEWSSHQSSSPSAIVLPTTSLSSMLWRPTSPGNEDVLICINAPFMTQCVLKPWWSWTYQNSAVKRASARAIPGWVTSWEVWYGEPKADNIVSLGVGRYKWYQSHCPAWDGGSVHKPNEGRQRGRWVQRGGDCDVPHRLGMRMCLYV
jgi:hypothetical protein